MNSTILKSNTYQDLATKLKTAIPTIKEATLAIVFCSPSYDIQRVTSIVKTTGLQIVGCSTAGEIHDGELCEATIVVMLMNVHPDNFKIIGNLPSD